MSSATASLWYGWHRPDQRSPWRPIVEADTEDAAFRQLLDVARGGDKARLPRGVDSNNKSASMRRRRL